jgi:hypothetical protein
MPIESHLPQADPFSLVPTFKPATDYKEDCYLGICCTSYKTPIKYFTARWSSFKKMHECNIPPIRFSSGQIKNGIKMVGPGKNINRFLFNNINFNFNFF